MTRGLPIATAPRDGRTVWVYLAGEGEWVLAYWTHQTQAWVRKDDPYRRTLHRVTHWRPALTRASWPDHRVSREIVAGLTL